MTIAIDDGELLELLRRLAARGARLAAADDGYRIVRNAVGAVEREGAGPVDEDLVRVLRSRGLVEGEPNGDLRLSETANALLRRHLAGNDGFAAQHQTRRTILIDDGEHGRRAVVINQDESPLAWLRRHKGRDGKPLIDASEFAAGERLRADYERGRIMPRVTANWSAAVADNRRSGDAGGIADLTEAAIAARRRVDKAFDAVGPDFASVLVDFCCYLKGIEEIERTRLWPSRSAKLVLRLALSTLARHYGITASAVGRNQGRLRHWGAEDYRPTIE